MQPDYKPTYQSAYIRHTNNNCICTSKYAVEAREHKRHRDALNALKEDVHEGWLHFYRSRGHKKPPSVSKISLGCFEIIKG